MKDKITKILQWLIFGTVFLISIPFVLGDNTINRIEGVLTIIGLTVWATLEIILRLMKKWEKEEESGGNDNE